MREHLMKTNEIEELNKKTEEEERLVKLWDCGSSLYDSHELVSIRPFTWKKLLDFALSKWIKKCKRINCDFKAADSSKIRGSSVVKFLKDLLEGNLWKWKKKDGIFRSVSKSSSTKKSKISVKRVLDASGSKICTRIRWRNKCDKRLN